MKVETFLFLKPVLKLIVYTTKGIISTTIYKWLIVSTMVNNLTIYEFVPSRCYVLAFPSVYSVYVYTPKNINNFYSHVFIVNMYIHRRSFITFMRSFPLPVSFVKEKQYTPQTIYNLYAYGPSPCPMHSVSLIRESKNKNSANHYL